MVALAQKLELTQGIDGRLHLLKYHLPYHESDHVMNFAINALCGGTCLEDIELRRNRRLQPNTPPPRKKHKRQKRLRHYLFKG